MSKDDIVLLEHPDQQKPASGITGDQLVDGQQASAGSMLREARQAHGLDIATLAASLKVPVQKLQALEQDQYELLLDAVFARALASSVCRILKLDPMPVLERLPAIAAFKLTTQNRGINAPFRSRDASLGSSSVWSHISRRAVMVGLALLLGALVLIFLPVFQQEMASYKDQNKAVASESGLVEPVVAATTVTNSVLVNGSSTSAGTPNPTEAPQPAEISALISTPAAAPVLLQPANAAEAIANSTLTFSAKGESWVSVTDAKGVVVLNRTLRPGETVGASGALPLAAVVGRADAIQVQVRGQDFGLKGVSRNNVARFEVK